MGKLLEMLRESYAGEKTQMVVEHDKLDLKHATIEQLLDSEDFERELILQIKMETEHHDELARQAVKSGLRLQRAPITSLMERGVFDAENIRDIYKHIICKTLNGFSSAEREYVKRLCMMAYWRVVEKNKKSQ